LTQSFDLGVHYTLRAEYRQAARLFQEVLREDPTNAKAWSYLGMAFAHLGQAREAEAALSRSLSLAPQDGEAWFHLGIARSLREEWPEAVSAYRKAVAYLPEDLVAWHRLGVALAESGDPTAASAAFERALVLSRETGSPMPEEPVAVDRDSHLGEVAEHEGKREAESWLDLALSLLSLGEEEEAIAAYERAFTLDPERAQHSLFRPMLRLLTAAQGFPVDDEPSSPPPGPEPPARPARPPRYEPNETADYRPEVG
jgi:tetratricopeptide (TPR) repeat protein